MLHVLCHVHVTTCMQTYLRDISYVVVADEKGLEGLPVFEHLSR